MKSSMKHISILVPKGAAALSCIEGAYILFNKANGFLAAAGKQPAFDVHLVGMTREARVYDRLFTVTPELTVEKHPRTDLILIPAVNGEMDRVISDNADFFPWIVGQYKQGAEVASLCMGAFLLAATGLLKGRKCATHWMAANDFRARFPEVELVSDIVITDEHGIYSSGGANSFWNLLLYLLEKYTDREMAITASKYYAIEIDRTSQSPFIMFQGQREHQDDTVRQAQEFVEARFRERISVDGICERFSVGRRSLERRFKKATSNTLSEYIQRVKMEAAKKRLETSRKTVNEVMYEVGYSDIKAFRQIFRKITGMTPIDYRNKYNKEALAA